MEVAALVIRQKIDKPVRLHVKKGSGIRVRTSGQRVAVKGARIYTVQRGPKVKRVSTKAGTSRRYNRKGSDAYRQGKRYYTTGRYQADPYYNKKRQVQAIQKEGYRKGKELKGKELGKGITQESTGLYSARFVDRFGKRKHKRFKKLQECRAWIADATYVDEHSDISMPSDMLVDQWFDYWIGIKKKTVRSNTVRNYTERYIKNIKPVIGKMTLSDVKPLQCQKIFYDMADQGYRTSTIYQARIALYNMFEYAKENEVLRSNPCKKSVKSDMGKPSEKKVALTRDIQKTFLQYAENQSYENQYRFILQTGLRTGELVGLKWGDVDFKSKTIQIRRSMEYRYSAKEWRIGEPKSKSGYRTIPLTEEAVSILKKQKEKNKRISEISTEWEEFVFLCRKGTPVKNSTYDTALFKICDKAKIPRFSMHILRHTFATRCIEAGMKPKTLQMLLGHSNIGITMNLYVHTTEEEKKKEMDLVAEALMAM